MCSTFLSVEVGEESLLSDVDEVLHSVLESPPLELNCHQLVRRHHWLHVSLNTVTSHEETTAGASAMNRSSSSGRLIENFDKMVL